MTTLDFEAGEEDNLQKTGFYIPISIKNKHYNPQTFIGLLIGTGSYTIGYDIYEKNIFENGTFSILVIKKR